MMILVWSYTISLSVHHLSLTELCRLSRHINQMMKAINRLLYHLIVMMKLRIQLLLKSI